MRWRVQRDMGAHAQLGGKLLLASVGGSETSEMQRRQSERALTLTDGTDLCAGNKDELLHVCSVEYWQGLLSKLVK